MPVYPIPTSSQWGRNILGHDINPLHRSVGNSKAARFPHAKCDLKNIMMSLWKKATVDKSEFMQQAAWMCYTDDAVGRPGGV